MPPSESRSERAAARVAELIRRDREPLAAAWAGRVRPAEFVPEVLDALAERLDPRPRGGGGREDAAAERVLARLDAGLDLALFVRGLYALRDVLVSHGERTLRPEARDASAAALCRAVEHLVAEAADRAGRRMQHLVEDASRRTREFVGTAEELARSEKRLRALLETLPVGVFMADASGQILDVNPAAQEIWGERRLVERARYGDYQGWWADTGAPLTGDDWALARALAGRRVAGDLIDILTFDGQERTVLTGGSPVYDETGRIVGAVAVVQDVTALHWAQQAQTLVAEAASILSGSVDLRSTLQKVAQLPVPWLADWCSVRLVEDDRVVSVAVAHANPADAEFARQMQADFPLDLKAERGASRVIRTGEPEFVPDVPADYPQRMSPDTGSAKVMERLHIRSYLAVPMRVASTTLGAISFAITEGNRRFTPRDLELAAALGRHCALALQNAQLFQQVQDAVRQREKVLAVVSHDLRNPLVAIGLNGLMAAEALEAGDQSAQAQRAIGTIRRTAERMKRQVADLLDMAAIQKGSLTLDPAPLDVRSLLSETVELFQRQAADHDVALEHHDPSLPRVHCDRARILQVLSNLVANALRFTKPGGTVRLEAAATPEGVRVTVSDTGAGVAPEHQDRIFDAYWSAPGQPRSTGLGLYIARGIVEAHGGRIWVDSLPGRGASFSFTLPPAG